MKVNQVTRVLSPATRMVRDKIQRLIPLDAHEVKDSTNTVIGWQIPKSVITHEGIVNMFTVNGITRVARSDSTDPTESITVTKYTHRVENVLIETNVFPEFITINLQ